MLGFVYTKLMILLNRKEINVVEASQDFTFADTEPFSAKEHNFFLAAALTQYDSNRTVTESKEYGEIEFTHYGWGNEDLGYAYGATHIPTHFCSEEELGLEGNNSTFWPLNEKSMRDVNDDLVVRIVINVSIFIRQFTQIELIGNPPHLSLDRQFY